MRTKFVAGALALAIAASALVVTAPAQARGWRHGGGGAIAGFAAGAIIGGALAASGPYGYGYGYGPGYYDEPVYGPGPGYGGGDAIGYCMSRFKSYDPNSGTYRGYDGMRHSCP